jgi:oligopeptidase B
MGEDKLKTLKNYKTPILIFLSGFIIFPVIANDITPPKANKEIVTFHEHGHDRIDPYHWLKQRENPQVLAYLKAENDYTHQQMKHTETLQHTLAEEFKNRIKQDDSTVPYRRGNYYYYARYEKDKSHPIYCRKKASLDNPEEIILDVNLLAKGHDYYDVDALRVSPNEKLLAYAEDTQGRRKYTIKIKDLTTGQDVKAPIIDTTASFEWANDSNTLFYTKQDPVSLRSNRIYQHKLSSPNKDKLIYEEKDVTFFCEISKTKSNQYLLIGSYKKETSEYRFLEANHPDNPFILFSPRIDGREYYIDHHQNHFIIRTNDKAPNFKLMQCQLDKTNFQYWQPFIPYDPSVYVENFQVFDDFLALSLRKNGMIQINIHPFNKASYDIAFDEPDYDVSVIETPEMSSNNVRFSFSSLKTPNTIYEYNTQTHQKVLKKQQEVLGGFDTKNYLTQRIYAKAQDGTRIPISIVYRKDKFVKDKNPLLITGYGSYGLSYDPTFNPYVISLLDRGFVYAISHIRGGSELGREWYLKGKLLNKKNTFTDFIDASEFLVKEGFGDATQIFAQGGSAGGLLMGAIVNMKPAFFKGIIAEVPFVDVINTMTDPDIPLTTAEYTEWGNPNDQTYYNYMLSYSPYDNIKTESYPNILVVAGFHDSQVQYWEAAKWVARLRDTTKNDHLLLLQTTMNAGHSGASGRYDRYREVAFEYAFLLGLS